MKPLPIYLFEHGVRPLVSVIPPNAQLSPGSSIVPSQRGKVPGRKNINGTWGGYNWLQHEPTLPDVKRWVQAGANIGLRADYYPAVDVDSLDEWLANEVAAIARRVLGPAPGRVGRAPKQLLMYRTGEPFPRTAAIIHYNGSKHLVEVLGTSRQYLIEGAHPSGSRYTWDMDLRTLDWEKGLTWIVQADVERFFAQLQDWLEMVPGIMVERIGGTAGDRTAAPQANLVAPSLDALRECVAALPNTDALFPDRDSYVKVGYAIRAAAGDDDEAGYEIFAEWASRHEQDGRVVGNPETWRSDWRRMHPPYSVGWSWLAETARTCGFNPAQHEFSVEAAVEQIEQERTAAPDFSDAWLVDQVIREHGDKIRYAVANNKFYVWDGTYFEPDATMLADYYITTTHRRLAAAVAKRGGSEAERARSEHLAVSLCSAERQRAVRHLLRSDPRVAVRPDAFDADPWLLNTPAGIVDLRTGELSPPDPEKMCSRRTNVAPDHDVPAPIFNAFLQEATGGDVMLQAFLQRYVGYALTGITTEQCLTFVWGPSRTGKGTFVRSIMGVMGSYAETAPMDTFTTGSADKHPTDLAGLTGVRLVTANETQEGRRWDEQRIKTLTGGDAIRVRFMRQDFFTVTPQFKLLISGNHQPVISTFDGAMQRRIHVVPFTHPPAQVNMALDEQLRPEYPAILAWMVQGCLMWQAHGLLPPESVLRATEEYLAEQDVVQRWLDDTHDVDPTAYASLPDLFSSWAVWTSERGESVGSAKRLAQVLAGKGYVRQRQRQGRGFTGLRPRPQTLEA